MQAFIAELRRRNVLRVAAFYAAAGWLLVQVVTQVLPVFEVSALAQKIIVLVIIAGFPLVLVLSWVYELTPQGIVKTDEVALNASITRQTGHKLNRAIIAMLSLAVLVLLAKLLWPHARSASTEAAAEGVGDKSIAVLPFDSLSDEKESAYFAEGIQNEILTRLAGIADLKVISRTSTEKYKSHPDNLRAVAKELGVSAVLEGSVQKAGQAVRVNVQLIDARADRHLWAQTYDRELKDVFAVESEVSQDIAGRLQARLSPSESSALAAVPTKNAHAYDWFLQAEHEFSLARATELPEAFARADDSYRQALALDPDFALARAQFAYCRLSRHWYVARLTAPELDQVKADIDRALMLAPDQPEAQVALGYYWYWGRREYERAVTAFRRVQELAPSNPGALLGMASILRRQGQWPQALEAFGKAAAVGPRDPVILNGYGETYELMRRYPEAESWMERALAADPDQAEPRNGLLLIDLFFHDDPAAARRRAESVPAVRRVLYNYVGGDVLTLTGPWVYPDVYERHFDQALKTWDAAPADTPKQRSERLAARVAILTLARRRTGAEADCTRLKTELLAQAAQQPEEPVILTGLSWAYVCLGKNAEAVRAARRAAELLPLEKDAFFGAYYLDGLAQIDAWAGYPDEAVRLIEQLLSIPSGDYMYPQRLKRDPVWDPLRADPRFQKLISDSTGPK